MWVGLRGEAAPLCNATDHGVKCFGKNDGLPLSEITAVHARWQRWLMGGEDRPPSFAGTVVVCPRRTRSKPSYRVSARTPDGTLWVGLFEEGPGLGLQQLRDGVLKTFVTPHFDGSKISVTSLMVDRDGNLWAGTDAAGVVRIHGDAVERYRQTDGLSGDSVWALFEDREGIVWAGTTKSEQLPRSPCRHLLGCTRDGERPGGGHSGRPRRHDLGGKPRVARSHQEPRRSRQSAGAMVFRGPQSPPCWEDRCRQHVGGRRQRAVSLQRWAIPSPAGTRPPAARNGGWTDRGCRRKYLGSMRHTKKARANTRFPGARRVRCLAGSGGIPTTSLQTHTEGFGSATSTGDVVLMRNGTVEKTISLGPRSSPLNRACLLQRMALFSSAPRTVCSAGRAGTVRRMTTKNGWPCDFVITFIQDAGAPTGGYIPAAASWSFSDAELQKWWANPGCSYSRTASTMRSTAPSQTSAPLTLRHRPPDGRVWFSTGVVVQMLDPSRIRQPARPSAASGGIRDRRSKGIRGELTTVDVGPHAARPADRLHVADLLDPAEGQRFATSSMATTTVGMRPVPGGRPSTPMCPRGTTRSG